MLATEGDHHDDVGRANESPAGTGAPRTIELAPGFDYADIAVLDWIAAEGRAEALRLFISDTVACLDVQR